MAIKRIDCFIVECDGKSGKCGKIMQDDEADAIFKTKEDAEAILREANFDAWDFMQFKNGNILCSDCQNALEGGNDIAAENRAFDSESSITKTEQK